MTCKDKIYKDYENKDYDHRDFCPKECGYLPNPEYCKEGADEEVVCEQCWLRELPEEETPMSDYAAMYNDILLKMEAQNAEIERLKKGKQDVELRLARATGAIAMIELLYGRKWMAW